MIDPNRLPPIHMLEFTNWNSGKMCWGLWWLGFRTYTITLPFAPLTRKPVHKRGQSRQMIWIYSLRPPNMSVL
jgi:hypothetical protein